MIYSWIECVFTETIFPSEKWPMQVPAVLIRSAKCRHSLYVLERWPRCSPMNQSWPNCSSDAVVMFWPMRAQQTMFILLRYVMRILRYLRMTWFLMGVLLVSIFSFCSLCEKWYLRFVPYTNWSVSLVEEYHNFDSLKLVKIMIFFNSWHWSIRIRNSW